MMAHHKRRRPKSVRSGCLLCKWFKHQGSKDTWNAQPEAEKRARISEREQRSESL